MGFGAGGQDHSLLTMATALMLFMRPPGRNPWVPPNGDSTRELPRNLKAPTQTHRGKHPGATHADPDLVLLHSPPTDCPLGSQWGMGQEAQVGSQLDPGPGFLGCRPPSQQT